MEHVLPELPYAMNALEPHISSETLEYHYGKHHATYVNNLNKLVRGSEFEELSLTELVKKASGGIFNNAAQTWNHTFYWNGLSPNGGGEPPQDLREAIERSFNSVEELRNAFIEKALALFGSGWVWLVKEADGKLSIQGLKDAGNPLTSGQTPLLTCDMWEHAYYIDYRNAKAKYLDAFWSLVNWRFVADNYTT